MTARSPLSAVVAEDHLLVSLRADAVEVVECRRGAVGAVMGVPVAAGRVGTS